MSAGVPQPLGSAKFEVTADTQSFTRGLQQAQAQAEQSSRVIFAQFQHIEQSANGLAILPRQLAAINQSVMATTNAVAMLAEKLGAARTAASGIGGGGAGGFNASGLMNFAYAIDDLQYGISAVVNNVAGLGMAIGSALGMGPPQAQALAAGLQIVAVVSAQVAKHWDQIFGDDSSLPRIKEGLDGLASSLSRIREELRPLKEVADQIAEGKRGMFGEIADQWGFGAGSLKNRMRTEKLQALEKEAKAKLDDERTVESMKQSREEKETGAAFRKAVAELPGGGEQLIGTLMARGMTYDEARRAAAGAARGNVGHLNDILEKIPESAENGPFAGLRGALPSSRKHDDRIKFLMGQNEAQMEEEARAREKNDRLVDKLNAEGRENQMRMLRDNAKGEIEDMQDRRDRLREERTKVAKEPKAFTGDFFDYLKKLQESAIEQRKLKKLEDIDKGIKDLDKSIRNKQREMARFE